ncbi:hypothetical protein F5X68DRAFT_172297 [Plectosphaerella plurivora]|uniref:RRM domain-containing protein n=1 Tax=Plectosphaerella plurivora TaxID=936078 RepID=A0A9P8V7J8_9PEZI|nr:hypothetical protein F5X68DRAFT_172297 [Plectosphaerella plurivora]
MFTLRHAAARAAAIASRRAPLTSTTSISRQFSIAAPRAFARTWVVRNTERPIEPLEETTKPGVESGVTLESEQKLAEALENPAAGTTEAEAQPAAEALESIQQTEAAEAELSESVSAKKEEAQRIVLERQRSLFVQNLSWDVTEDLVREDFGAFGEITNVFRAGGRATWCIVTYAKPEDMQEASKQVNGTFWHGRRITAIPRQVQDFTKTSQNAPRRERVKKDPTPYLYIGNMPYDISDAELTELFDSVDDATGVRIATDAATGMPRGYAHVDFRSVEAAVAAAKAFEGKKIRDRTLVVDFAAKREQRQQRQQPPANRDRNSDWSGRSGGRGGKQW